MTQKHRQELLDQYLFAMECKEIDIPVIDEKGRFLRPILNKAGIVQEWEVDDTPIYHGLVLEINDHGNVTLMKQFKNGKTREIASRV